MIKSGISARRRLTMPLLVLAVAGLLWWWGSQQNDRHIDDIRQFVSALCSDAQAGREDSAVPAAQSPAGRLALRQMRTLLADHRNEPLAIEVSRGDISGFNDGSATHSAIISAGSRSLIGLRLAHPGDAARIEIVGYWTP